MKKRSNPDLLKKELGWSIYFNRTGNISYLRNQGKSEDYVRGYLFGCEDFDWDETLREDGRIIVDCLRHKDKEEN